MGGGESQFKLYNFEQGGKEEKREGRKSYKKESERK
jgi:hypothetical protein